MHIERLLTLFGDSPPAAAMTAREVIGLETLLARASYDRVTLRDPRRRANTMTVMELAALAPSVDFSAFFRASGASSFTRLNVIHPEYVRQLTSALAQQPLDVWKAYLRWRVLSALVEGVLALACAECPCATPVAAI
jgi:predicted metalloendopeptidase